MMKMKALRTLAVCLTVTGTLAACGGNDVDTVVTRLAKGGKEAGITLDKGCAKKVVEKLSKDDLKLLIDAGEDDDPTLSDEGEALKADLFGCVDNAEFIDALMKEIPEDDTLDRDCVRKALEAIDPTDLAAMATDGAAPAELGEAMVSCVKTG
jgi:hypothetical protein